MKTTILTAIVFLLSFGSSFAAQPITPVGAHPEHACARRSDLEEVTARLKA